MRATLFHKGRGCTFVFDADRQSCRAYLRFLEARLSRLGLAMASGTSAQSRLPEKNSSKKMRRASLRAAPF
jgi:hypothetical protein